MSCCGGSRPPEGDQPVSLQPVVPVVDIPSFNITVRKAANGGNLSLLSAPNAFLTVMATATRPHCEFRKEYLVKVVLLGDTGVGKTSLMRRFKDATFTEDFKPTIGVDFCMKPLVVGATSVQLQIWDTAGQERFRAIATTYYRGASAAMVVFDLSRRGTFLNLNRWISEMQKASDYNQHPVLLTLVGNKSDLGVRDVSAEEVQEFINENQLNARYVETSARDGSGVDDAFAWIAATVAAGPQAPPGPNLKSGESVELQSAILFSDDAR